jgi:hypothetical protein
MPASKKAMHTTLKSHVRHLTTADKKSPLIRTVTLFILFLILSFRLSAQADSCHLRVSLLTCGPGDELYSVFGHSALRVTDNRTNSDVIFNYGTFDFADPEFYSKFVKGKLLYYVSVEQFNSFMYAYQMENRYVIEQVLNLTCAEKQNLSEALRVNALDQNKYYKYEFLFDNCSTRLRDIVARNTRDEVHYKRIIAEPAPTFRNMLHEYLFPAGKYWSAFGIDLLLASRIDRKVKNEEAMFLPDYLAKGFDSAWMHSRGLVLSKELILPSSEENRSGFSITPMMVNVVLLLAGIALSFTKNTRSQKILPVFDGFLFFVLGAMGCLMLFMWYGTEHELCRNNYNLYWALPTHIVAAFFVNRTSSLIRKYFTLSAIIAAVFLICWPFLPQGMNSAFFPLVLLSALRSFKLATKKAEQHAGTRAD